MKRTAFFEKFDEFADAPYAIAKLRQLVLQLAVTGKLVEQIQGEPSAAVLLEDARSQRSALVTNRKIKARPTTAVGSEEQPFELPQTWQWARLSDVGHELGQKVPDQRFTYIDVGSIDSDKGRISDRVEVLEANEAPSRARKLVSRGTVIYSTVRPYLQNIAIVDRDFDCEPIASTAFGILHPFMGISSRFLFYWLRSASFIAYVQDGMKGMAYPAINDETFYSGYIPVAPSAEQMRIVAKVDELIALCDRLEAQEQERNAHHAQLARASLARFAEAPTPANLNVIFQPSCAIRPADLRQTILNIAVRGRLVLQDPNDEPAAELVSAIEARKDSLTGEAKIRKTKACRPLDENEIPHDVPPSWSWAMLGEITDVGTGSTPSRTQASFWSAGSIPWITSGSTSQKVITKGDEFVTEAAVKAHRLRLYRPGTLLVALYGQGRTRGQVATLGIESTINQACAAVCPVQGFEALQAYLRLLLEKNYDEVRLLSAGGAQPNLNVQKIKEILVPVPPLAE